MGIWRTGMKALRGQYSRESQKPGQVSGRRNEREAAHFSVVLALPSFCSLLLDLSDSSASEVTLLGVLCRAVLLSDVECRATSGNGAAIGTGHDYYAELAKAGDLTINPKGPDTPFDPSEPDEKKRVHRGGSFLCNDQYCSRYIVGTRGKGEVNTGTNHLGFRCVKSVDQPPTP